MNFHININVVCN